MAQQIFGVTGLHCKSCVATVTEALEALLAQRCAAFTDWARQEALHRRARDAALRTLAFPEPDFRPGQRGLAEAVYRGASAGRCLLAQAPTGIGKTLGTLFPLLRAVPAQGIDRVAWLTCKGTGRRTALQALTQLRDGMAAPPGTEPEATTPSPPLRVLAVVAEAVAAGDLTADEGQGLAAILEIQRRAIETADLSARVEALEQGRQT